MTKQVRSAAAFAERVKMGASRVWVIVEGVSHDRPFYDGILSSRSELSLSDYSIRLAEQISVEGISAGGKAHVRTVYEWFAENGALVQRNRKIDSHVVFALDRDLDDLAGVRIRSDHVVYTTCMDVEAEILLNAQLDVSVANAYSVSREDVSHAMTPDGTDLATELAMLWRAWITLGACSIACGVGSNLGFASRSRFNGTGYEEVDVRVAEDQKANILSNLDKPGQLNFLSVEAKVDEFYASGRPEFLVKGKWLGHFIQDLLRVGLQGLPRQRGVRHDSVVKCALSTLDFADAWARPYHVFFDRLLMSATL